MGGPKLVDQMVFILYVKYYLNPTVVHVMFPDR